MSVDQATRVDDGFGTLLRRHRLAAGLTQEELADRAGLSVRTISDLERSHTRSPHRGSGNRLADALGLRAQARTEFIAATGRRLPPEADTAARSAAGKRGGLPAHGAGQVLPRQLPAAVPTFVGRHEQMASLSQVLDEPGGTTVVTAIGGAAGMGKTALAVHWAHRAAGQFPDGQLFLDLRGFDPSVLPVTAAAAVRQLLDALEVPADRVPPSVEAQSGLYRSLLVGKRMLVLLDNASDAAQVRPLLPGSPTCRTIVTSRNKLTGLTALDGAHPLTLDILTVGESHALLTSFLGTARIAAEPDAVAAVIEACGCLPLALTITAARAAATPHLPLAALAAELGDTARRLDALRIADDPVASVRVALDCSYAHLASETARTFRLLSVHPGPDISLTATAGLTDLPLPITARHLADLAEASLIIEHTPGRYRFHDLVRLYAAEQARTHEGETDRQAALRRVLDFYLHTAAVADQLLAPQRTPIRLEPPAPGPHVQHLPDDVAAVTWFDAEYTNLLSGQQAAAARDWHSTVWWLAWNLGTFQFRRGYLRDQLVVWQTALKSAEYLPDPVARTRAHRGIGHVYSAQGNNLEAIEHLHQALALAEQHHDLADQASTLDQLAWASEQHGDDRQALQHVTRALELFRILRQPKREAEALNAVGWYAARIGDYDAALADCLAALALNRDLGNSEGEATTLDSLGYIEFRIGHHQQAIDYYQSAFALFRDLGDAYHAATALSKLGYPHVALGHRDNALTIWRQALELLREQGQTKYAERIERALAALDHPVDG